MSLLGNYKAEEKALKKSMGKIAGFSILASLCLLVVPIYLFQIYDRVLFSRSIETLVAISLIALVVLIAYGVFDTTRLYLLAKAGVELDNRLSGPLLAGELSRQSDTNKQSLRDLQQIRHTLATPTFAALFDIPVLPIFLIIVFLIHPGLGAVVLTGIVILVLLTVTADRVNGPLIEEQTQAAMLSNRSLESQFDQQEIIRAQGLYRESVNEWGKYQGDQLSKLLVTFMRQSAFSASSKSARQLIQIGLIGIGAYLVLLDQANPGIIFATSVVGSRALAPIEAIIGGWRNLKQARAASLRLKARMRELHLPARKTPLPKPKGTLSLERVVYVPRPGTPPILKGISGSIAAGDSVAIIGPSGAGKSTLARIMVGYLEPSNGAVSLDGQDLRAWDPVARGLSVGYMPQQVSFFEATIGENIARLRRQDPKELAVEAAQLLGVHEMILQFPNGYDTLIAKGHFWPSGGQSQLIGLARAFYGNPSVLILDEPNAALDQLGEQIFHRALAIAKKKGMTTIVVTQRPNVLQFVDKVMILKDGQVDAFGPKDEVMKSSRVRAVASNKDGAKPSDQTAAQAPKPTGTKPAGAKPPRTTANQPKEQAQPYTQPGGMPKSTGSGQDSGQNSKQAPQSTAANTAGDAKK